MDIWPKYCPRYSLFPNFTKGFPWWCKKVEIQHGFWFGTRIGNNGPNEFGLRQIYGVWIIFLSIWYIHNHHITTLRSLSNIVKKSASRPEFPRKWKLAMENISSCDHFAPDSSSFGQLFENLSSIENLWKYTKNLLSFNNLRGM